MWHAQPLQEKARETEIERGGEREFAVLLAFFGVGLCGCIPVD